MRKRLVFSVLALGLGGVMTVVLFSMQADGRQTPTVDVSTGGEDSAKTRVMAWIPYWDQESAVASLKVNKDKIDSIGLFWYYIRSDGSIAAYEYADEDQELIKWAHEQGIEVMAIVTNLPDDEGSDWDADLVDKVIDRASDRRHHVEQLLGMVEQMDLDGVQIDYESLRKDQKSDFTRFIRTLGRRLHRRDKVLGVGLMSKVGEDNPEYSNGSEAKDWRRLSRYADHLYLMTYEEHWETSQAGPIASVPWVEQIIRYARQQIPAVKLYAGVPLYGYDWGSGSKARGLTYAEVADLIETYQLEVKWDEEAGGSYFTYEDKGSEHEVWFENAASVRAKSVMFKQLGVQNIALWRLGGEDTGVWDILSEN